MKKILPLLLILCLSVPKLYAQNVGVGNTSPNSKLDVSGDLALREGTAITVTGGNNIITLPSAKNSVYRLTGATAAFTVNAISAGNDGMVLTLINATGQIMTVRDSTSIRTNTNANLAGTTTVSSVTMVYNATLAKWIVVSGEGFSNSNGWNLTGNAGTTSSNFIGTTDNNPLYFKTNGSVVGYIPSSANTSGNTGFGVGNGTPGGSYNVFMGFHTLSAGNTGNDNVTMGWNILDVNTTGSDNIGMGWQALTYNTTGSLNVALGSGVLEFNKTANNNIGIGPGSLQNDTTGGSNIAVGDNALHALYNGSNNTVLGHSAGSSATGSNNVFLGYNAGANELTSNKLYIANSNTATPLLYGDFTNKHLTINDSLTAKYLQLTNGATSGYLLQSDASGNATWVNPSTVASNAWGLTGNSGTVPGTNFIGTSDNKALEFKVNNTESGYIDYNAGVGNTGLGYATFSALSSGTKNAAFGYNTMGSNTSGSNNAAMGFGALNTNTTGNDNTAIGNSALSSNTTASYNTAVGWQAQTNGTTANNNVSVGHYTLFHDTTGTGNVVVGANAMPNNYNGSSNTVVGYNSGASNQGSNNVFLGNQAGSNETGSNKLYIANSNTSTPLLYGDFTNQHLTVNDSLTAQYFQMTHGAAFGDVLLSDANGNGAWVSPASVLLAFGHGTQNYVTKWNNVTGTTIGNSLIYDNGTNVGIGTTSPGQQLEVNGNIVAGASASTRVQLNGAGGTNAISETYQSESQPRWAIGRDLFSSGHAGIAFGPGDISALDLYIGRNTNGDMQFQTGGNGNNRMTILSAGNVGIGTTAPDTSLQVVGKTQTTYLQMTNGATSGYVLQSDASGNASWVSPSSIAATNIYNSNGSLTGARTVTIGSSNLSFVSSGAYILLDPTANGRTGIGTASPISLFANTPTNILGSDGHGIVNNSLTWSVNAGGYAAAIYNAQSGASADGLVVQIAGTSSNNRILDLSTSATQGVTGTTVMAVLGTGNVGIGTGSPQQMLSVNTGMNIDQAGGNTGTVSSNALTFGNSSGEGIASNRNAGINQYGLDFYTDYINRLAITSGGNVGIGTTNPGSTLQVNGKTTTTNLEMTNGAASGYILQSDASGNGSWVNPSSVPAENIYNFDGTLTTGRTVTMAGSDLTFSSSGGSMSLTGGNLGIGRTSPGDLVDIQATSGEDIYLGGGSVTGGEIKFTYPGVAHFSMYNNGNGNLTIANTSSQTPTNASGTAIMSLSQSGNVGIGTTSPNDLLTVGGSLISNLNPIVGINTTGNLPVFIGQTTSNLGVMIGYNGNDIQGRSGTNFLNNDILVLNEYGGNVGIGTTTPGSTLTVNGTTSTTNFQMTNGGTANYILQSDASGNGTWVSPSSIAGQNIYNSDGTLTGNRTVTQAADNITFSATSGNFNYTSTGNGSVAMGNSLTSSGHNSFAAGAGNTASGNQSFASGSGNTVSGNQAFVTGNGNTAAGPYSLVSGLANIDGGTDDIVGGFEDVVVAGYGHALAIGYQDSIAGSAGAVFGVLNKVRNYEGFAQGDGNNVPGQTAAAFGSSNTASGSSSFVTGNTNAVNGNQGFAAGTGNTSESYSEMATGLYGTTYTPSSTSGYAATDRVFDIGNGSSSSARSDAMTILKNGNVGIGNSSPTKTLQVNGTTSTTNFQMTNGGTANYLLQSDASGNGTWVSPASISANNIYNSDGTLTGARTVTMSGNALNLNGGTLTTNQDAKINGITVGVGGGNISNNVAVGNGALNSNTSGDNNTAVGNNALVANTTGYSNTVMGYAALSSANSNSNTAIGSQSMYSTTTGNSNVALGFGTLQNNITGSSNTVVGYNAGGGATGSNNVFLGNSAGASESGSNLLYIANTGTSSPLIYGNFTNKHVTIHDSLTAKYPQFTNGAAAGYLLQSDLNGNGTWVAPSSIAANNIYNSNGTLTGARTVTMSGNTLNFTGGDVGIGTASTNASFNVNGNAVIGTSLINRAGSGLTVDYSNATTYAANTDATDAARALSIVNENSTASSMAILSLRSNANGGANNQMMDMKLVNPNNGTSSLIYSFGPNATFTDRFTMTSAGYLGIGTTAPQSQLANTATNIIGTDGNGVNTPSLTWAMNTNGYVGAFYNASTVSNAMGLAVKIAGTASTNKLLELSTGAQTTAGTSVMVALGNGNVGIGTSSPVQTLTTQYASGLWSGIETANHGFATQTGTSTSDYILYEGADKTNGLSYIQSVRYGTSVANLGLNTRGGNVGIGTGNSGTYYAPTNTLSINGSGGMWNYNEFNFYADNGSTQRGFIGNYGNGSDFALAATTSNWMRIGANNSSISFFPDGTITSANNPMVKINPQSSSSTSVGSGTYAVLEVWGVAGSPISSSATGENQAHTQYGWLATNGTNTSSVNSRAYSLYTWGSIWCNGEVDATSDERIKDVLDTSDNARDLAAVNKLNVVDYQYIDKQSHGDTKVKGFLAQQVETVFPDAVKTQPGVIPNIYRDADIVHYDATSKKLTVTMGTDHGLVAGDKVQIKAEGEDKNVVVSEVIDSKTFVVEGWEKDSHHVFVFGKEVPDLRNIDYNKIFSAGISAIQELSKKEQQLETENETLKARNEKLEKAMSAKADASQVEKLEAEIEALQQIVGAKAQK